MKALVRFMFELSLAWLVAVAWLLLAFAVLGCGAPASVADAAPADVLRLDVAVPNADAGAADTRPALALLMPVYGHHAAWIEDWWHTKTLDPARVALLPVEGSPDSKGQLAFNASASCCDDTLANDDEDRLVELVRARVAQGDVNPHKVWAWGHSNGAFMALRLACDHADLFAGAVEFAGAFAVAGDAPCAPSQPISVLDIHGTHDDVIYYDRDWHVLLMPKNGVPEAGAGGTLEQLALALACSLPTVSIGVRDVASAIAGSETDVLGFTCGAGFLEHWRVNGAGHLPQLVASWPDDVLAWTEARAR